MNGSRHLLSLVSQMEKGCTVQSEQGHVTNEGDISTERRTERLMDNSRTHKRRQGSGGQKKQKCGTKIDAAKNVQGFIIVESFQSQLFPS